jgi:putative phage-type endonuclease
MLQQGTDEWRQARCGSVGASDAPSVVRRIKSGGYSADRATLLANKVLERVTGVPTQIAKTFAMQQGTAREPEARLRYALQKNFEVEETGLVPHPRIKGAHASPDGYVLAQGATAIAGLVEIKCPMPAQHLDTLLGGTISNDHIVQVQWQLACSGLPWCDYVSFSSDFPGPMQLWIKRVERDPPHILNLEGEITRFLREVEQKVEQLSRRYAVAA